MKYLSAYSLLLLLTVSVNLNAQKIKGDGNVVSQDRSTGSFEEIHLHGSFNVEVTDGNTHKVTVEAEQNIQPLIVVETNGNRLNIRHKKDARFNATKEIKIYITAPALKEIALSGSGNVKSKNQLNGSNEFKVVSSGSGNIDMDVATQDLRAGISGSGNMNLKGSTKSLDASISGSGNIRARDLKADVTSVKISGSGSAEVVANQSLDSKISGSGDVRYWGNASVNSKVAGSGSVRREQ